MMIKQVEGDKPRQSPGVDTAQPDVISKCGYVAIVGRPNVGKSTLLNHILKQKLSITSRKPQTTRHNILGIKTEQNIQAIYVDTPGLHKNNNKAINRYMNREAGSAAKDVDLIIFVVEKLQWLDGDELVLSRIKSFKTPVIVAINKVDQVKDKEKLLPFLQQLSCKHSFAEFIPISALKNDNLDQLETLVNHYLPKAEHFFEEDQITDKSSRFLAAEIVREKIMRQLGEELPYQVTVEIEEFKQQKKNLRISAVIIVERSGQKQIIIGHKGERIKLIGIEARKDMQHLFATKIMLNLWVKVKSGWSDDERAMRSLGYD